MIKLIDIIKEVVEGDNLDISDLENLDDELKLAIQNAPENEIIGTVSLVLAAPGLINAITKVVLAIYKKSGFNLQKKNDPNQFKLALSLVEKVTAQLDNYLDRPFRFILTPFIKDPTKRDTMAKILKAITLAMVAIIGVVDIRQLTNTVSAIKHLAPQASSEILQAVAEHSAPKLTEVLKNIIINTKI